jgi:RHS repeat-associated protein
VARQARLLQRRTYSYSPDGYVTEIDDMLAGLRRYDLDPARRVTAVRGADWQERYAYDTAGKTTNASWAVPPHRDERHEWHEWHEFNFASQGHRDYTGTLIRRAGNIRYEYDTQGRVVLRQQKRLSAKPRTWRYTWDADDRLTGVTTPDGQRWCYRYDPFGRRVAKQRLGGDDNTTVVEQIDFIWDGDTLAEQIRTPAGSSAAQVVTTWDWEPDSFRPLTQAERHSSAPVALHHGIETGSTSGNGDHASGHPAGRSIGNGPDDADQAWFDARFHAIVTDLVGMPTELVAPDGDLAWHAQTTLWGTRPLPADGDVDCPLRFPGQYHDPETGTNYNYHRHYDPTTGRYESGDPIGLAADDDPHRYVPNTLTWADPYGLAPGYKKVEVFERYGSRAEGDSITAAGGKLTPKPSPHERNPKWIADDGVVDPRTLGKRQNYTHRFEIHAKPGTRDWLKQFEIKSNEPGRYAVPADKLAEFNEKIVRIVVGPR